MHTRAYAPLLHCVEHFIPGYSRCIGYADRMFVTAIERNPADTEYAERILGTLAAGGHVRQATAVQSRGQALGIFRTNGNMPVSGKD